MVWQAIMRLGRHALGWSALAQRGTEMRQLLESAKQFAIEQDWFAAVQHANLVLDQAAPKFGLKRWIWNRYIRPIQQETQRHFEHWEANADKAYDRMLAQSRWLAVTGQFPTAIAILEPIHQQFFRLEGKQHLETLGQVIEYRNLLYLALLAERDEHWETAIDAYDRLLMLVPEMATEIRFRLALTAIKTAQWDDATQRLTAIAKADWNSLRATALLEYVATQRGGQPPEPMPTAPSLEVQPTALSITDVPALTQAAIAGWEAKEWTVCARKLSSVWLIEGSYTALHRWSVAAYYAALAQPDRPSIETCLMSRNMALANLAEYSEHAPEAQQELVGRLHQQIDDLIEAIDDRQLSQHLADCNAIDQLAIREFQTASYPALRWKSLLVTPMIYRRIVVIAQTLPQLPESYLGALYTDWADPIWLWQQGKVIEARKHYPTRPTASPVDRYAKNYVAYYEGCDYLTVQPAGYPRWREAKPHLFMALAEIRASERWQDQLNQLFEAYYFVLWEAADRRELTQFWIDLLNTTPAHYYFQQAHDT